MVEYLLEWPIENNKHHIRVALETLCGEESAGWAVGKPDWRYRGPVPSCENPEFCEICATEFTRQVLEGNLVVNL